MKSKIIPLCVDRVGLDKGKKFYLKEECLNCDGKNIGCNFYYASKLVNKIYREKK